MVTFIRDATIRISVTFIRDAARYSGDLDAGVEAEFKMLLFRRKLPSRDGSVWAVDDRETFLYNVFNNLQETRILPARLGHGKEPDAK